MLQWLKLDTYCVYQCGSKI